MVSKSRPSRKFLGKSINLTIRIPQKLYDDICAQADREMIGASAFVRRAVLNELKGRV